MSLKDWISRRLGEPTGQGSTEGGVNLAVAALLVEVLRADFDVGAKERQQVIDSVARLLRLEPDDSAALVAEAERQIDQSHDLYQFTSQVNQSWSEAEKLQLLESLWHIARADAIVHKYEEHLIRRISDLLHVRHRDFISAKLKSSGPELDG